MNKITIIGNLVANPETKTVKGGYLVTAFAVACNRTHNEDVDYFHVSVWGPYGKTCQKYLSRGGKVYVEGVLAPKAYAGADGAPHISLDVTATLVEFLSPRGPKADTEVSMQKVTDIFPCFHEDFPSGDIELSFDE